MLAHNLANCSLCTELRIERKDWFFLDENDNYQEPPPVYTTSTPGPQWPGQEGNKCSWDTEKQMCKENEQLFETNKTQYKCLRSQEKRRSCETYQEIGSRPVGKKLVKTRLQVYKKSKQTIKEDNVYDNQPASTILFWARSNTLCL